MRIAGGFCNTLSSVHIDEVDGPVAGDNGWEPRELRTVNQRQRTPIPSALSAVIAAGLAVCSQPLRSEASTAEVAASNGKGLVRFVVRDTGWPPQPQNISTQKWATSEPSSAQVPQDLISGETAIRNYANQQSMLGPRYAHISTGRLLSKEHGSGPICASYFSHSRNRTVELALYTDGTVKTLRDLAASAYQPELAPEEVSEAVDFAKKELLLSGLDRIAGLQAYAILPYRTDADHGFYDERLAFVSFRSQADGRSELGVLVDLTHQRVIRVDEARR